MFLVLAAVDLRGLDRLDERDGFRDARLQLREGFLGVLVLGYVHPREARDRALRGVARDLHLPLHREHVRIEPEIDQRCLVDFLPLGVRLRLVEDGGEIFQHVDESRGAHLIHRDIHDILREMSCEARILPRAQAEKRALGRRAARPVACLRLASYFTSCAKIMTSPMMDASQDRVRSQMIPAT